MKISYLVTIKNETHTFKNLMERLTSIKFDDDEIVILDDFSDNPETTKIINYYVNHHNNITHHQHALNNDYGEHKNYGTRLCKGDWICQIDGDELPSETLIFNIREIIQTNLELELIYVPRINDFKGVTEDHAKKWGWRLTPYQGGSIVNWPDYQSRIYKREPERIKWDRKLHEKIVGHNKYAFLPADFELALYHDKTIEKQIETNIRYNQQFSIQDNLGHTIT